MFDLDGNEEIAMALAAARVDVINRQRRQPKPEKPRWKLPPPVVRSVVFVQAMLRRRSYFRAFGHLSDELDYSFAPPEPFLATALYFCRRARNPRFVDYQAEALAVAGIISLKEVGVKMSDITEIDYFYRGMVPDNHLSLTILKEKLDSMVIRAQESLQEAIFQMEEPTPANVHATIEHCRATVHVPDEQAERVFSESKLYLSDACSRAAAMLRRDIERAATVPELDAVRQKVEVVYGPVETPLREEVDLARMRRRQFLEMELETRWSRPFAGPLPPHSRAARRYELELGKHNPKVRSFVHEERRYVSALEAAFEVDLARCQAQLRDLATRRRDARARSIIADIDEKIDGVNTDVQRIIENAIVQIGCDNPKVTQYAKDLLSHDAHCTVYSIQAERVAEELRMEIAQHDPSPEAGDRRRGAALDLEALLDRLSPLHHVQRALRDEFAHELADVAAARVAARSSGAAEEQPEEEKAGPREDVDIAGDREDDTRAMPTVAERLAARNAPKAARPRSASTLSEPEGEDPWGAPSGYAELEHQDIEITIPGRERKPNGGLPENLVGDDEPAERPDRRSMELSPPGMPEIDPFDMDPSTLNLLNSFIGTVPDAAKPEEPKEITLVLTMQALTMDFVEQHGEAVFKIKLARTLTEAVNVSRQRIKIISFAPGSVKATLVIHEASEKEALEAEPGHPPKTARQIHQELLEQLDDGTSRLRLGELGPFLGEATLEQAVVAGPGAVRERMEHNSVAAAYSAQPLGGSARGATRELPNFSRSFGSVSTVDLGATQEILDRAAGTMKSAWGQSRMEPTAPAANSTFRTTCPNAKEDGTTERWAIPYDRQPAYTFYSKDKEAQAAEPTKMPKGKQKFTAHATFHITRHPVGVRPTGLASATPGPAHFMAANSWLPPDGGAKLPVVDAATLKLPVGEPGKARDLEVEDAVSPAKSIAKKKKGKEDTLGATAGSMPDASPGAKSDQDLLSDRDSNLETPSSSIAKAKKKATTGTRSKGKDNNDEPEPEASDAPSETSPMSKMKSTKSVRKSNKASAKDTGDLSASPSASMSPSPEASAGEDSDDHNKTMKERKKKSSKAPVLKVVLETGAKEHDAMSTPARSDEESSDSPNANRVDVRQAMLDKRKAKLAKSGADDKKGKKGHAGHGKHEQSDQTHGHKSEGGSELDESKAAFPEAHCWAGMYGGMPGTGTRRLHEEHGNLPDLVAKGSTADPMKTPAYCRQAYRHGTVGVGPPYRVCEEQKQNSPQWSAYEMVDASIGKMDWKRSYSTVSKSRLGKLGPAENIRAMRSQSLPKFGSTQQQPISRRRRIHQARPPQQKESTDLDELPPGVRQAWEEQQWPEERIGTPMTRQVSTPNLRPRTGTPQEDPGVTTEGEAWPKDKGKGKDADKGGKMKKTKSKKDTKVSGDDQDEEEKRAQAKKDRQAKKKKEKEDKGEMVAEKSEKDEEEKRAQAKKDRQAKKKKEKEDKGEMVAEKSEKPKQKKDKGEKGKDEEKKKGKEDTEAQPSEAAPAEAVPEAQPEGNSLLQQVQEYLRDCEGNQAIPSAEAMLEPMMKQLEKDKEVCHSCGNVSLPEAAFCVGCGVQRPDPLKELSRDALDAVRARVDAARFQAYTKKASVGGWFARVVRPFEDPAAPHLAKVCQSCLSLFTNDARFCGGCGVGRPEERAQGKDLTKQVQEYLRNSEGRGTIPSAAAMLEPMMMQLEKDKEVCYSCGNVCLPDTAFCGGCGVHRPDPSEEQEFSWDAFEAVRARVEAARFQAYTKKPSVGAWFARVVHPFEEPAAPHMAKVCSSCSSMFTKAARFCAGCGVERPEDRPRPQELRPHSATTIDHYSVPTPAVSIGAILLPDSPRSSAVGAQVPGMFLKAPSACSEWTASQVASARTVSASVAATEAEIDNCMEAVYLGVFSNLPDVVVKDATPRELEAAVYEEPASKRPKTCEVGCQTDVSFQVLRAAPDVFVVPDIEPSLVDETSRPPTAGPRRHPQASSAASPSPDMRSDGSSGKKLTKASSVAPGMSVTILAQPRRGTHSIASSKASSKVNESPTSPTQGLEEAELQRALAQAEAARAKADAAATRVQAIQRGRLARKELKARADDVVMQQAIAEAQAARLKADAAVTKVQSMQRGRMARQQYTLRKAEEGSMSPMSPGMYSPPMSPMSPTSPGYGLSLEEAWEDAEVARAEAEAAAIRVQALQRGRMARKRNFEARKAQQPGHHDEAAAAMAEEAEIASAEAEAAAIRVQALQRGRMARRAARQRQELQVAGEPVDHAIHEAAERAESEAEFAKAEAEAAAIRVQALQRGRMARRAAQEYKELQAAGHAVDHGALAAHEAEHELAAAEAEAAATRVQAIQRGRMARRAAEQRKEQQAAGQPVDHEAVAAAQADAELATAEAEAAALRVQALQRGRMARRAVEERKAQLAAGQQVDHAAVAESEADAELARAEAEAAAIRVQAMQRGRMARRASFQRKELLAAGRPVDHEAIAAAKAEAELDAAEVEAAATRVQALQRGRMARRALEERKAQAAAGEPVDHEAVAAAEAEAELATAEAEAAATRVQAIQRGRLARRAAQQRKELQALGRPVDHDAVAAAEADAELADAEAVAAATKVQAIQRGRTARRAAQHLKEQREAGLPHDHDDVASAEEAVAAADEAFELATAEAEAAAVRVQALQRGKMARRNSLKLREQQAAMQAAGQHADHDAAAAEMRDAVEEAELDAELASAEAEAAATRVQALQRGRLARRAAQQRKEKMAAGAQVDHAEVAASDAAAAEAQAEAELADEEAEAAALRVQALQRGRIARREAQRRKEMQSAHQPSQQESIAALLAEADLASAEAEAAAVKLQAIQRGRLARRDAEKRKAAAHPHDDDDAALVQAVADAEKAAAEAEAAAVRVQALQRGRMARRRAEQKKRQAMDRTPVLDGMNFADSSGSLGFEMMSAGARTPGLYPDMMSDTVSLNHDDDRRFGQMSPSNGPGSHAPSPSSSGVMGPEETEVQGLSSHAGMSDDELEEALEDVEIARAEAEAAATRVQALMRGRMARQAAQKRKEEAYAKAAAGGPAGAADYHREGSALDEEVPHAKFSFKVRGVDYHALCADMLLLDAFENATKDAVAEEAGYGVHPEHVELVLSAGSVVVACTVTPPDPRDVDPVLARLTASKTLAQSILGRLANIPGIEKVCEGGLFVDSPIASPRSESDSSDLEDTPLYPPMSAQAESAAAVRLQAVQRGRMGRREAENRKANQTTSPQPAGVPSLPLSGAGGEATSSRPQMRPPVPPQDGNRSQYQMTNTAATRLQVENYVQSLNATIFRNTHAQYRATFATGGATRAAGAGGPASAAVAAAALMRAQMRGTAAQRYGSSSPPRPMAGGAMGTSTVVRPLGPSSSLSPPRQVYASYPAPGVQQREYSPQREYVPPTMTATMLPRQDAATMLPRQELTRAPPSIRPRLPVGLSTNEEDGFD